MTAMTDNRTAFLNTIKNALKDKPNRSVETAFAPLVDYGDDAAETPDADALLQKLLEQATLINIRAYTVKDADAAGVAVADLVSEMNPEWGDEKVVVAWPHPLIKSLKLENRIPEKGAAFHYTALENPENPTDEEKKRIKDQIVKAYIGVTTADYCVAETGTLVIRTVPDCPRSVSLAPSIHVAVIEKKVLVNDLKALYKKLRAELSVDKDAFTRNMTFITGPSKTGDIELVMVHGAHGPRYLYLFIIEG